MVALSKFIVEQIRVSYASGLYHKADLAVRYSCYFEVPTDIMKVLNYEVFTDVKEELRMKIFAMGYIFAITEEYREAVTIAAIMESEKVVKDSNKASSTIQEVIRNAEKTLKEKLVIINKEFGTSFTPFDLKSRIIL